MLKKKESNHSKNNEDFYSLKRIKQMLQCAYIGEENTDFIKILISCSQNVKNDDDYVGVNFDIISNIICQHLIPLICNTKTS